MDAPSIVHLEPMRYASAYAYGDQPEEEAWRTLAAWARPRGLLGDFSAQPVFGFNNPYPTATTPRYGYELWLKVGPEVEPEGSIRVGEFFGGDYAVFRCEVGEHPERTVPAAWRFLVGWCDEQGYPRGRHHAFEKYLSSPETLASLVVELYCPVGRQESVTALVSPHD